MGVTLCSVVLSSGLKGVFGWLSGSSEDLDALASSARVSSVVSRLLVLSSNQNQRFRRQPCYFITQGVWLAQTVPNWLYMQGGHNIPIVFGLVPIFSPKSEGDGFNRFENTLVLV